MFGFRVSGSGSQVSGSSSLVSGLGWRVDGGGWRVEGEGLQVSRLGWRVYDERKALLERELLVHRDRDLMIYRSSVEFQVMV